MKKIHQITQPKKEHLDPYAYKAAIFIATYLIKTLHWSLLVCYLSLIYKVACDLMKYTLRTVY